MDYLNIKGTQFIRFKKGEAVIKSGEIAEFFYIVISGTCHRIRVSDKGDETILYTYRKDNILCAFIAYYHMMAASDIVADNTVYCYKIPREAFLEKMNDDMKLMRIIMEQIMQEHMDLLVNFHGKREGRTPNLLCSFILKNITQNEDGIWYLDKKYSNVKLAQIIGVHKVTATRIVNELQKQGILQRTSIGLVVHDREQLELYALQGKKLRYGVPK